ncbi:2-dehydropantoate 2-reductase [Bosea sp. CRIB-10]|uniref:ketopantoate reductase family protein n=1 Tax=Bosea sp. CRIB-10 TaxID=378404 RepID=UPI0008DFD7D2|nr:ketopantoate reductase family protein [Bosea sp. CRIB-10]SFD52386.1 2-dehydropantoate 2-reductase [Bosea sp. CRIB-10]
MRIAVLGAGGVGGYFGGRLAASGSDVTFVARGAHLAAMRDDGLRIVSPLGDLHLPQVKLAETVAELGPVDLVLVGVKLWDTEQVAASLAPIAEHGAAIISLQNGVQKDDILRRYVPAGSVMGGVCYIAATIAGPGIINHAGPMQRLVIGEYGNETSARAETFLAACLEAGITAELSPSIERSIWEKFVFLVGLSGTTARYNVPIGPIRNDPQKREILLRTMQEVVAVGQAKGVPLPAGFAEDRLGFCDTIPETMTSSMQVDLERGNRLELPWLSGAVVSLGKELNVATPVNADICDALEPHVLGRR